MFGKWAGMTQEFTILGWDDCHLRMEPGLPGRSPAAFVEAWCILWSFQRRQKLPGKLNGESRTSNWVGDVEGIEMKLIWFDMRVLILFANYVTAKLRMTKTLFRIEACVPERPGLDLTARTVCVIIILSQIHLESSRGISQSVQFELIARPRAPCACPWFRLVTSCPSVTTTGRLRRAMPLECQVDTPMAMAI